MARDPFKPQNDTRPSVVEPARGPVVTGPPKSAAGKRDVTIPAFLLPDVSAHLDEFAAADPRALVFPGSQGRTATAEQLHSGVVRGDDDGGLSGFRFHDLRHTGNALGKRAEAELKRSGTQAGTRQEEALRMDSLVISENMALAARFQVERMTGANGTLMARHRTQRAAITRATGTEN
jgi:hypothetical protein